jgi:undecaprenyl-diphosphatase
VTLLQGLILGVVQGLTEFLPISSSAHLVLVPWALGWNVDPAFAFAFDVLVQMGTLVAVIAFYAGSLARMARAAWAGLRQRRPFDDPQARLAWLILLATLPAVVAGLLLHDAVAAAFASPRAVSLFLLVTAALLAGAERFGRPHRELDRLHWRDALSVGAAQALALFPGISRSGSTISAGLLRGLLRPEAARLSFLMSIPVMLGAAVVGLKDLADLSPDLALLAPLAVGFVTSTIVGYLVIRWLLAYLAGHRLTVFAAYCLVAGTAALILSWLPA